MKIFTILITFEKFLSRVSPVFQSVYLLVQALAQKKKKKKKKALAQVLLFVVSMKDVY